MTIRRLCWELPGRVRSRATSAGPVHAWQEECHEQHIGAAAGPPWPGQRCRARCQVQIHFGEIQWASKSCTRFWKWVESSISSTQGRGRGGGAGGGGWASARRGCQSTDAAEATDGAAAAAGWQGLLPHWPGAIVAALAVRRLGQAPVPTWCFPGLRSPLVHYQLHRTHGHAEGLRHLGGWCNRQAGLG